MDEHIIVGISSHIFSFQQGVGIIVPYCICNMKRYSNAQAILAVFWAEKIFKLHFQICNEKNAFVENHHRLYGLIYFAYII